MTKSAKRTKTDVAGKAFLTLPWDTEAAFIERPNRFKCTAQVDDVKRQRVEAHVTATARMAQLLIPNAQLRLRRASNPNRKTKWDLLAIQLMSGPAKGEWVLANPGCHRELMENVLADAAVSPFGAAEKIIAEYTIDEAEEQPTADQQPEQQNGSGGQPKSRLDFVVETEAGELIAIETKGCTLAIDGIALFPDAPTDRGRRHLRTLMQLKKEGLDGRACRAAAVFLVFHPAARSFAPHRDIDPEFADLFYEAVEQGVEVYPLLFEYDEAGMIRFREQLPVEPKPSDLESDARNDRADA